MISREDHCCWPSTDRWSPSSALAAGGARARAEDGQSEMEMEDDGRAGVAVGSRGGVPPRLHFTQACWGGLPLPVIRIEYNKRSKDDDDDCDSQPSPSVRRSVGRPSLLLALCAGTCIYLCLLALPVYCMYILCSSIQYVCCCLVLLSLLAGHHTITTAAAPSAPPPCLYVLCWLTSPQGY